MPLAIVTGSSGLVGSETATYLHGKGYDIIGIDNDMRRRLFGDTASVAWNAERLKATLPRFVHENLDIRDKPALHAVFAKHGKAVEAVIHCAAQPSHDWARRDPEADFTINALGTLHVLEAVRAHCPEAAVVFTSTNKVYGDTPNFLPLVERETRWECDPTHPYAAHGIDETMSIDRCLHSVFGASKVAADVMCQEYARSFGLKVGVFRGGCLTGPMHAGAELHGFLSYLARCVVTGNRYNVYGYKGKQVRDNIHAHDLADAFFHYIQAPKPGAVYNIGGSRHACCSVLEAIAICERLAKRKLDYAIVDDNRLGDHIWWISDVRAFQRDYPSWRYRYDLEETLAEIVSAMKKRLA